MKIIIKSATFCNGKPWQIGDLVEASDKDANLLIRMGKAEAAPVEPEPKAAPKAAPKRKRGRPSKANS